jgi:hypothetical protein
MTWYLRERKTMEQRYAISAERLGIPYAEYMTHISAGESWCVGHRGWEPEARFKADHGRPGRLRAYCAVWHSGAAGARRLGISTEEYQAHINAGEKRCAGHHRWEPRENFGPRESAPDGLDNICQEHNRSRAAEGMRRLYWQRKREMAS